MSRREEQIVRGDFDFDWRLLPGLVPHSEQTTAPSLASKGCVALEDEFGQRFRFARIKRVAEMAENARLAVMLDVGAEVEKFVRGDRLQELFAQASPEARTHP